MTGTQSDWVFQSDWVPVRLGTQSDWVPVRLEDPVRLGPVTQSDWEPVRTGHHAIEPGPSAIEHSLLGDYLTIF